MTSTVTIATPLPAARPAARGGFFAGLPPLAQAQRTFAADGWRAAPDDWAVVVTDVVDSTGAIAAGRHKAVNFVAAMAIAAAKNLCAPEPIPFLFGGDGAALMVPPAQVQPMRRVLARVRGAAAREYGLKLRVGLAEVAALRRCGGDVRVARFEPSPGNPFGVFAGGGVSLLEAAVRGLTQPDLAALAAVPESLDDGQPVDLTGLSCRWAPLPSRHGKMLALIVHGAPDAGAVYAEVLRLAGLDGDPRPARHDTLVNAWPPKDFMLEARARRQGGWLPWWTARVLGETLFAHHLFRTGRHAGAFDPQRYRDEITTNTDFCRYDGTLCFVLDCSLAAVDAIRAFLATAAAAQGFEWGLDVSDTALMTCLVTHASEGLHVHFVDGGGGGYTQAARQMKAARAARAEG